MTRINPQKLSSVIPPKKISSEVEESKESDSK